MGKTKIRKTKTTDYAVLFGQNSVKGGFRKVSTAQKYAQMKANKTRKAVDIDKITRYPLAKRGEMDWSQRTYKTVKPKKC